MKTRILLKLLRFWPPFWGAGIRVKHVNAEMTEITSELVLRFWNRNVVYTQFGGSLYAMTDPFYMFLVMYHLGNDYIVWDKAATIRFKKPGRGTVQAHFKITPEQIAALRQQAEGGGKVEPVFPVVVMDAEGTVIAEVDKTLYIRKKQRSQAPDVAKAVGF